MATNPVPQFQARAAEPAPLETAYSALSRGQWQEAAEGYEKALAANPEERDALIGLAYVAHRLGRESEARERYRQVLRLDPRNPTALAGLMALNPVDSQEQMQRTREAAEQHPDSAAAQSLLGHSLAGAGKLAEAQQAFLRAMALEPAVALHVFNVAVATDRLRNYGMATLYYQRAIELSDKAGGPALSGVNHALIQNRLQDIKAIGKPVAAASAP